MINNYNELIQVKEELKNRIYKTEQDYVQQYELINTFLNVTGIHKGKKNENNRKHIHALIIQSITEYLKEEEALKKYKEEYKTILIPFALTLISTYLAKKF